MVRKEYYYEHVERQRDQRPFGGPVKIKKYFKGKYVISRSKKDNCKDISLTER